MLEFSLALSAFVAAHTLPAMTGLRDRLMRRLGRAAYLAGYSTLSIALLAWLIWAAWRAPYIALWDPRPATAAIPLLAMLPACLLLAGAAVRPNPLSIAFLGGEIDPARPGVLAITRHPFLWAFFLWSASHAVANGDAVGLIMFGGFAAFSVAGMRIVENRARRRLTPAQWERAAAISSGPLPERLRRAASRQMAFELAFGTVLYGLMLWIHPALFGVNPLGPLF